MTKIINETLTATKEKEIWFGNLTHAKKTDTYNVSGRLIEIEKNRRYFHGNYIIKASFNTKEEAEKFIQKNEDMCFGNKEDKKFELKIKDYPGNIVAELTNTNDFM